MWIPRRARKPIHFTMAPRSQDRIEYGRNAVIKSSQKASSLKFISVCRWFRSLSYSISNNLVASFWAVVAVVERGSESEYTVWYGRVVYPLFESGS